MGKCKVAVYQVHVAHTRSHGFLSLKERGYYTKELTLIDMKASHYEEVLPHGQYKELHKSCHKSILEGMYKLLNIGTEYAFMFKAQNNYKGRSLSVGDIVRIDNVYYYCEPVGWEEVTVTNVPSA